jgi:uncharacterized damage-inducible protein DinB
MRENHARQKDSAPQSMQNSGPSDSESLVDPVIGIRSGALESLRQGREMLETISPEQYSAPCPQAFDATIGQHYRHCLDHFELFISQMPSKEINYDLRDRQARIETSPNAALEKTRQFERVVSELDEKTLNQTIRLSAGVGDRIIGLCHSTVARELYYVTAHAIHHYALIAVIGNHLELSMPRNFGIAPSTVAYLAARTRA